jgi:hypothetical protein
MLTDKTNEEGGNVEDVCRVTRRVVVHFVLLARLVLYDVEEDVDRGIGILWRGAVPSVVWSDQRSRHI